jgi:hypothetical protein
MGRRWKLKLRALGAAALSALLPASCAVVPRATQSFRVGEDDHLGCCAGFFHFLDQRVSEARVIDPGAFRVEGFPYLRVNRLEKMFLRKEQN